MPNLVINRKVLLGPPSIVGGGLVDVSLYTTDFGAGTSLPAGWSYGLNNGPNWSVVNSGDTPVGSNGYGGASGFSQLQYTALAIESSVVNSTTVNCTGYNNIRLSFGIGFYFFGNPTPSTFDFEYSANNGVDWNTITVPIAPETPDDTWELREYSLPLASNASQVILRITVNSATDGLDQLMAFDDFTFIGDEI